MQTLPVMAVKKQRRNQRLASSSDWGPVFLAARLILTPEPLAKLKRRLSIGQNLDFTH